MFRFTNSGDITSSKDILFKAGKTKRILLRYTGTNQAGQTMATTDLGTVQILRQNRPIANLLLSEVAKWNDLRYGTVLRSSSLGAAIDMSLIIDFSQQSDGNVLPLTDDDYISIPAVSTVVVSALTVSVYQDVEDGSFLYVPRMFTRTETLSAEKPVYIPDPNLYVLMLSEPSTAPTKIILTVDGVLRLDVPYAVAEIVSNADNRHETGSSPDFVILDVAKLANTRGHSYELQMVGGSGTLTYTTFAVDVVPTHGDVALAEAGADISTPRADTNIRVFGPSQAPKPRPPAPRDNDRRVTPGIVVS